MKQIMKASKGWFIFAYLLGIFYFALYAWEAEGCEAKYVNIMLLVLAHLLTLGAYALSMKRPIRRKILVKELALFTPIYTCFIFFTPEVMGLIGGYAIYLMLGYCHIRVLKEQDLWSHIPKAKTKEEATELSDEQLKYVLWIALSAVPLLTLYWNI